MADFQDLVKAGWAPGEEVGKLFPTNHARMVAGPAAGHVIVQPKDPAPIAKVITSPNAVSAYVLHDRGYELAALTRPAEGKASHKFLEPIAFARWLRRRARPEKTDIFIAPEGGRAVIDPERAEPDVVQLLIYDSRTLRALRELLGSPRSQAEIKKFADVYGDVFVDEVNHRQLLDGVTTIEANSKGSMTSQLDEYGNIAVAMNSNQQTIETKVPGTFTLQFLPWRFISCVEIAVEIRLGLSLSSGGPRFTVEAPGLEDALDEGIAELANHVESALNDGGSGEAEGAEQRPRFFVGIGQQDNGCRHAPPVPEIDPHLVELLGRLSASLDNLDAKFGEEAIAALVARNVEASTGEGTTEGDPE